MSEAEVAEQKETGVTFLLFVLLFVTFGYFYQSGQHNANARFDLTRAIVEHGIVNIDPYRYNTADAIEVKRKTYSNKAPGMSFAAVPVWWLGDKFLGLIGADSELRDHLVPYLSVWIVLGGVSALGSVYLFLLLKLLFGSASVATAITLAYSLGTIAFPFSTIFFSHQFCAALLIIAFYLLVKSSRQGSSIKSIALAGFLLGFAVVTEYPAALAVLPIGLYGFFVSCNDVKSRAALVAAGFVAGLFLIFYNIAAFGDPFFIPYSQHAKDSTHLFKEHSLGFMGVQLPSLEVLKQITFMPQRGLFFCNPWLVLLLPAFFLVWRGSDVKRELAICVLVVVLFFAMNAGYGESIVFWGGGSSVGPRHIIPMLPFAAVLIAGAFHYRIIRYLFVPLSVVSVSIMLMATAVEPRVTYNYMNPVVESFWRGFLNGEFATEYFGPFNSQLLTSNSVAFNWGKLIDLPGCFQLTPLLVFWTCILFILKPQKLMLSVVCAMLAFLAIAPVYTHFEYRLKYPGANGLAQTRFEGIEWGSPTPKLVDHKGFGYPKSFSAVKQVIQPVLKESTERNISYEWKGYLLVPDTKKYGFTSRSDDGSCIYIDGKLISDNWGIHGLRDKHAWLELEEGLHSITVRYYNAGFGSGMYLLWEPYGEHLRLIPSKYLFISKKGIEFAMVRD